MEKIIIGGPKINNDQMLSFDKKIRRRGTEIKLCIYCQLQLEDQIKESKTSVPEKLKKSTINKKLKV